MTVKGKAAMVIAPEAAPVIDMTEELQKRKKQAAARSKQRAAARAAAPPATPQPTGPAEDPTGPSRGQQVGAAFADQTGAPAWYQAAANPQPIRVANTGGGFVLGVLAWVLARAYLEGGPAGVKKLLKAKFLNQVEGS